MACCKVLSRGCEILLHVRTLLWPSEFPLHCSHNFLCVGSYNPVPIVWYRKGHVCMIPGTKEFFIAAHDHDEWGSAHTVWGMVSVRGKSTFTGILAMCVVQCFAAKI